MKQLLLASIFILSASISYAGSGCGDSCGGDKDKKKTSTGFVEQTTILTAKSCGGCSGDKDKSKTSGEKSFSSETLLAGSGCGGCSGDKDKKDKAEKSGNASALNSATLLAGSGCGDSCGGDKKDPAKKKGFSLGTQVLA